MSGNPFRRSRVERIPDDANDLDSEVARASSPKTKKPKKRVQIISPPQSPVESPEWPRKVTDGDKESPPQRSISFPTEVDIEAGAENSAHTALVQATLNARLNSRGSDAIVAPTMQTVSGTRAPYNPFARTLATSEAAFGLERNHVEITSTKQSGGPTKMDVDVFRNILLTGSADSIPPNSQSVQNNSSGTEASSISRQSMFDHAHDLHSESPRTSMDHEESSDDDQTEHSSLMGSTATRSEAEGPPLPPKHTHGKRLRSKGPQTVSFADFDQSIPDSWKPAAGPRTPPPSSPLTGILRPSSPKSPGDLNKPLPPPPEATSNTESAGQIASSPELAATQPHAAASSDIADSEVKRAPPPPPAARRQAQISYGRPRSSSNLTQSSMQDDIQPVVQPNIVPPIAKFAPPPPPSRRANNPAQPPHAIETPSTPTLPRRISVDEARPMPPPPRRQYSKTGSGLTRTPSNSSHISITRSDGAAPPAPPPRRTGGSSWNSLDGTLNTSRRSGQELRRTSGQSETSSLQAVDEGDGARAPSITEASAKKDVLADLEALHAEVDALRAAQSGKG